MIDLMDPVLVLTINHSTSTFFRHGFVPCACSVRGCNHENMMWMSRTTSGTDSVELLGVSSLSIFCQFHLFLLLEAERSETSGWRWRLADDSRAESEKVFESRSRYVFQLNDDFSWELLAPALILQGGGGGFCLCEVTDMEGKSNGWYYSVNSCCTFCLN